MAIIQEQLKLKIEELKKLNDVSPIPLRGQIILAYRQKVLAGILDIIEKSGDDEQKLYAELQIFLGENWKKYGLSPVDYIALPNDPITEFLCDIAIEIAKNLKNEKLAIGILMPGVQTQVTVDSAVYPDLDDLPLKQVIKTHIINRNGGYLLPVKFLIQITASGLETGICNHYYDGLSDDPDLRNEDLASLDAEEKHRLFYHSSETRSIIEAKQHFDILTNDNSNLLSQLNTLALTEAPKTLLEKIKGPVAYMGLDNLKIPDIQFLNDLGVRFSIVHIEDLTLLSVDDFNVLCLNENYRSEIVIVFNKDPINAYADLSAFAFLSKPDMLRAVLSQFAKELFVTVMQRNSERLGLLLNVLNNERFEMVCIAMSGYFKEIFYKDPPYDEEHPDPKMFFSALKGALNAEKGHFLISKTIDIDRPFPNFQFSSISDLKFLHEWMPADSFAKFIEANMGHLSGLGESFYALKCIHKWVPKKLFEKFVETKMECLPKFLRSVDQLKSLRKWISKRLFQKVIETHMNHFFVRLYKLNDLMALHECMHDDLFEKFIGISVAHLPRLWRSFDLLKFLHKLMSARVFARFFEANMAHLFGFLKSFYDLQRLLELISADLFEKFIAANMAHLPSLLLSFYDLECLYKCVSEDLFVKVMTTQLANLPCFFDGFDDLKKLILSNDEECEKEVGVKRIFHKIMPNERDSLWIKKEQHITYSLYAMSAILPEIIHSPKMFSEWMNPNNDQDAYSAERIFLNERQKIIIFKTMKPALIAMFEENPCEDTLKHIIQYLNDEQRAEFFSDLLNRDNGQILWIRTASNFCSLAEAFNGNEDIFQRIATKMMETGKLAKCINYYLEIVSMEQILTSDQMEELERQWMKDFLPIYNAKLSFFSNPRSVRWSEEMKRREVKIREVFRYATLKPSSRTADAVSEMRERRGPIKVG